MPARHGSAPSSFPPWAVITPAIARLGRDAPAYRAALGLYLRNEVGIDTRDIDTYWKRSTCAECRHTNTRKNYCKHTATIVDICVRSLHLCISLSLLHLAQTAVRGHRCGTVVGSCSR
jgi:transposase